jgi:cell division septation protein DedD
VQDHLKERLTGATILVIIVVLLVPEILRGPPATIPRAGTETVSGPPVRSYTIDLLDSANAKPAGVAAPAAAAQPHAASEVATTSEAPTAVTAAPQANAVAPSGSSAPSAAMDKPVATPAQKPAPAPVSKPANPAHPARLKSGWTVQVGSFSRRDYAERMAKQMAGKGYSMEVAGPDDHGLYRVRSAPLADRTSAQALKQKLQASGLKPIVNTVP